jgi:hypothetical protein
MVDMVMKMKFIIVKYSQIFNRVGPGYGGLVKFTIVDQYVTFLQKDITLVLLMLSFTQQCVNLV